MTVPAQDQDAAIRVPKGHRVEVDAANALLGTRALQPTQEDLGSTGIRDCALPQATFDLRITRRLTVNAALRGDAFFFAFATQRRALAAAGRAREALAAGPIRVRTGIPYRHAASERIGREA
jgi:hypothetical protein